jgi:hypothetical protein
MRIYPTLLMLVILLAGCSGQTAGSFMGGMVGAVCDGVVCGLTGADPETQNTYTNAFSELGALHGMQSDAQKLGVDLNKVPKEWMPQQMADVRLEKRSDGKVCYWLGNDHLVWDPVNNCWMTED